MQEHAKAVTYETFRKGIEHPDPAICTHVMIGLIKLTTYLLDRQIRHLERAFVQHGGLRERMAQARLRQRRKNERRRRQPLLLSRLSDFNARRTTATMPR